METVGFISEIPTGSGTGPYNSCAEFTLVIKNAAVTEVVGDVQDQQKCLKSAIISEAMF